MSTTFDHFLRIVDAYQLATGLSEAAVSRQLFGSGVRLAQIRSGERHGINLTTLDTVLAYMSESWPQPEKRLPPAARWPKNAQDLRPPRVSGVMSPTRALVNG